MEKGWKVKLPLGATFLLAGIFVLVYEGFFSFIFGMSFIVTGLVLLAPLVPNKVKLLLGVILLLAGILPWVFRELYYVNQSIAFIVVGLVLLVTLNMAKAWRIKLPLGAALSLAGILLLFYGGTFYLIFSIPLVVTGLLLLAAIPHGKPTDMRKPLGVTAVGVFTLLGSIGVGWFSWITGALSGIGSWGSWYSNTGWVSSTILWFSIWPAVFALAGLCLSIVVLRGVSSKYLWCALMAYWVWILAFCFIRDYIVMGYIISNGFYLVFFLPAYVYAASCITYFLTKKPRKYFNVKINRLGELRT